MLLVDAGRRAVKLPELRLLAFGGEALPCELAAHILRATDSSAETLNTYGKTEAAGFLLFNWFEPHAQAERGPGFTVPLTRPVPGTVARLEADACSDGGDASSVGELVVDSTAVAMEIESADGHVVLRKTGPGEVATLRTGDIVRRDIHGLTFIGRADRQVKINGVRVNLEQLELRISAKIGSACCAIYDDHQVMLAIETHEQAVTVASIARTLHGIVPAALLPRRVVNVATLPHNRSGKIDIVACERLFATRGK